MEQASTNALLTRVLVSDFDGTMTRHDFYKLAIELLLPSTTPDYWAQYRAGEITHFEALRSYFVAIRNDESEVLEVMRRMEIDPHLANAVTSLQTAGWKVVIASAGCEWYMRRLLASVGAEIEVHANPGRFEPGKGLIMEMPTASPFYSPTLGIDKAGVVRCYVDAGQTVAFAGDGFPDADPARLVPAALRFARGDLAQTLRRERLPFKSFESWSDIAHHLLGRET
jgi:2,3-diketo-5-methylthio-1-phosphopentane phosphatase